MDKNTKRNLIIIGVCTLFAFCLLFFREEASGSEGGGEGGSNGNGSNGSGSNDNSTLYEWNILNDGVKFKYIDMTLEDRIESIKTNGDAGAFFLERNEFDSYNKYHNELTSVSGFYDAHHKIPVIYVSLNNITTHRWINGWHGVANGGCLILSAGKDGHIVCIGGDYKLWRYQGGGKWGKDYGEEGDFKTINVAGENLVCAIKKDGRIYKSNGATMVPIPNNDNIKFKHASIGEDHSIFATDENHNLYKLEADDAWTKLNKKAKMVAHYNESIIYIVNLNDNLEQGIEI